MKSTIEKQALSRSFNLMKLPHKPAPIVAAWLTLIALSLLLGFTYADVAVHNIVMAISAFSIARLSKIIA